MKSYTHQIRVRYEETDRMGFVYYGKYLTWFEVARSELFRHLKLPYVDLEKKGVYLPVVEAVCRYESPLTYDDLVEIKVRVSEMKNASIAFEYEITKDGKLTTIGKTTHVFINKDLKPVRIPAEVKEALK